MAYLLSQTSIADFLCCGQEFDAYKVLYYKFIVKYLT